MKSEKGITLMSIVIYIILLISVIGLMSIILTRFYANTNVAQADTEDLIQFNYFNTYFLKEIKTRNNQVETITGDYLVFTSGNTFSKANHKIYYNGVEICKGIEDVSWEQDQGDKSIINVTLLFENFEKSITYKIEEIY